MKIIGVIPARYESSRFPGKPLADICGKPMIWWVYQQVSKVEFFTAVYVATDDQRILDVCRSYGMNCIMTSKNNPDHICRIQEVSEKINADFYIGINGDEPLIKKELIETIFPEEYVKDFYFGGLVRTLVDAAKVIDNANIKIVLNANGEALYMSRTPVPYPKGTLAVSYKKYVGVECFNKNALDFFRSTPMGQIEKAEDIDHLRFLEHRKVLKFKEVKSDSISVDTPKDLEYVRTIVEEKIKNGELSNE